MEKHEEKSRLESIAADSWYARGVNADTIRYSAEIFGRHWRPGPCLELGPAEGIMTDALVRSFEDLTVVDGSEQFCESLRSRYPRIHVSQSLFEEYRPRKSFETIVLGHVLEHVENPVQILQLAREWLTPTGRIYAAVPNARSLHRQAAVLMGLLQSEFELNATDIHHGHRRVYDPERFRFDFRTAGLKVDVFGGYWIKPLSNAQIDATWTQPMIHAFMALGERYPDTSAEIYVIASK